ncbi:Radial spoke protein 1, partial [Globisporangium splendens]
MASGKATKSGGTSVVYDVGSWRLGDDGSIYRRGRLKCSNGDIYDGEWLNGKRHGKGTLKFAEGGSCIGEFGENFYHGFGLLTIPKSQHPLTKKWVPGERYEGEFMQGRKHGKGTAKTRNGDCYDGFFVDGYYHGKGTCAHANGDIYDGDWVHGKWQGHGELQLRDGSKYVGEFYQGVYHGFGQFLHGSGGKLGSYAGHYVQGKRHGKGLRVFGSSDKKQYEGEWEEDEPRGVGVVECAAYKLVGRFMRGKECGHGSMSFANGESYEISMDMGSCVPLMGNSGVVAAILERERERERNRGLQDERSERRVSPGTNLYRILSYQGEFLENVRHGNGHVLYTNGDRVLGPLVKGFAHGVVEYRFAGSGKSRFAEFHHGMRTRWLAQPEEDAIRAQEREREQVQETETSRQKSIIRALIA